MFSYFYLLTLAIATAGVGATNTSTPLSSFDVSKTSFPLTLRSTSTFSVPFTAPQKIVSNSSFLVSLEDFVKKPVSDDVRILETSIVEAAVWPEIKLFAIVSALFLGMSIKIVIRRSLVTDVKNNQPEEKVAAPAAKENQPGEKLNGQEQKEDQVKISDDKESEF